MQDHKVIVFGSLNMDLSIECPRVPLIGETMLGSNFFTNPGGKGANQAVAAAKLGATVHMLGAVGDDAFGDQMIASLAEAGVNCERIARVAGCPTGVAMIERIAGDNCIVVDSGANMRPTAQFVREGLEEVAQPGDIFLTQLECDFEETMASLRMAYNAGLTTVINPAPARELPLDIYPYLDMVVVNETECEELTGIYPSDDASCRLAMEKFLARGVRCSVITLGERGSALLTAGPDEMLRSVPPQVTAIDTTCAGDTYIGALVAARANGTAAQDAMRLATRASALATTRVGAQQSIPTLAEANSLE